MRHMKFDVKNHPTKETAGITIVRDEHLTEDGTVTKTVTLGELTKTRGEDGYRAAAYVDGAKTLTELDGLFVTRSQAGHAVRAAAEKTVRSNKKADVLTIEQVAEKLGISVTAAKKRASRGTTVQSVDGGYRIAA